MAKITLIGPGAIGGVVAGSLARRGGHRLALCGRRPVGPITIELTGGTVRLEDPVLTDPAEAAPADWVFVTTKAYDAAGAARWFPALVGPDTVVAILQNGVEHRERFAPWLPPERILPVMVDIPAERPAPDLIIQRGAGRLAVPAGPVGDRFVALFAGTALDAQAEADFTSVVWRKLCTNVAGVISALVLKPAGIMRDENIGLLARELVRECITVGRAEGAVLEDDIAETVLARYRQAPPDSVNSLHGDRAAGRPMEIEARNGAVVRFGEKHGIPTPCNRMAAVLLAAM
jgi:2-dehydropantoate 2-reductase